MKKERVAVIICIVFTIITAGCRATNKIKDEYLIPSKDYLNLTAMEIEQNANKIVIVKREGNWEVSGREESDTEKERAKYFIGSLKKLHMEKYGEFKESSRNKFLQKKENIKVKIYANNKLFKEFIIGNSDVKEMKCYIIIEHEIYIVNRLLFNIFSSKV